MTTVDKLNNTSLEDLLNVEFHECNLSDQGVMKLTKAYKRLTKNCIKSLQAHIKEL